MVSWLAVLQYIFFYLFYLFFTVPIELFFSDCNIMVKEIVGLKIDCHYFALEQSSSFSNSTLTNGNLQGYLKLTRRAALMERVRRDENEVILIAPSWPEQL